MIKRVDVVNQIARKCRVRREDPSRDHFTKRELLLVNSGLDLLLHANEEGKRKLDERKRQEQDS